MLPSSCFRAAEVGIVSLKEAGELYDAMPR
jgi:hypothetical protein